MRFTDLSIKALPFETTGSKKYWDDAQPGFGIRCTAKSKSFIVMYGQERRLKTIGKYPQISLKMARRRALELKVDRDTATDTSRLSEARTAYLTECQVKNRPNTVRSYRLYLEQIDKPLLTDIKRDDVDHTNPHMVTAWKVFMNWCVRNELLDRNPFAYVPATYNKRNRVLTPDELRAIWHYDYPPYSDYLKLQILTGQRIGQWKAYESSDGVITFPASVMKSGIEHTIPATELVLELVEQLEPFNGWSKAKARLDKHVPLPHWTVHDIRRTFATIHAQIGTPIHVVEAMLAHRSGTISGVAAVYIKYNFLDEARQALTRYEEHISSIVA